MALSNRLKAARKECKLTQQQLADILDMDRSTYTYYELGTSRPTIENLANLCSIFNVDQSWFMDDEDDLEDGVFHSRSCGLAVQKDIKESNMTQLTKDERQMLALFRVAKGNGNKDEFFSTLREIALKINIENEE